MAAALRLIALVALLVASAVALAQGGGSVPGTITTGVFWTDPYDAVHYPDAQSACQGGISALNGQGGAYDNNGTKVPVAYSFMDGWQCVYHTTVSGNGSSFQVNPGSGDSLTCPSNSAPNAPQTACLCVPGFKTNVGATACIPACGSGGGQNGSLGAGSYTVTGDLDNLCAPDGCKVTSDLTSHDGSGQWAQGPFTNTGATCTPTSGGPQQAPGQNQCTGADMCGGTVNGTFVCAKCAGPTSSGGSGGTTPSGTTTSTTSTDATGTSTTTTDTTSKSTTDDPATGTSTTTTTTVHGDGSGTSSTTTCKTGTPGCPGATDDQPKDSFGGSCGGAFACSGDAIQCAVAQEQHRRACQMYEPETAGGAWSEGAAKLATAKADGDVPTWSPSHPSNAVTTNFDWSTTIDHSSSLSAACPADVPIGTSGRVLPLAALCPYFGIIGVMVESLAAVVCLLILFKGK